MKKRTASPSKILLSTAPFLHFLIRTDSGRVSFGFREKRRQGELTTEIVRQIALLFEGDALQFTFMPLDNDIVGSACDLVSKYGLEGLRSLDSIQLATALSLKSKADLFITSDRLLQTLLVKEQLPTATQ